MTHLGATSFADYIEKKAREEAQRRPYKKPVLTKLTEAQAMNKLQTNSMHEQSDFPIPTVVANAAFWLVIPRRSDQSMPIGVECERWIDVRDMATRAFGNECFDILPANGIPTPRFQLRWEGSAAGLNDLRKQYRYVTCESPNPKWREMRDFVLPKVKSK